MTESYLYKAVCARLLQVNLTERINMCCLCHETVGETGTSVDDEVLMSLPGGRRFQSVKISYILKLLLDDSFTEIMYVLKSVCRECTMSAVNGYRFIQCCREKAKILTETVEKLEESVQCIPNDKHTSNSLYIAINPSARIGNSTKTVVKRYYDKRRLFVPQDTAFSRFKQITEVQKEPQEKLPDKAYTDEIRSLVCSCRTNIETNELLYDPTKPFEFNCKVCRKQFAKGSSLRIHFFRVHREANSYCKNCLPTEIVSEHFDNKLPAEINENEDPLEFENSDIDDHDTPSEPTEFFERDEDTQDSTSALKQSEVKVMAVAARMEKHAAPIIKRLPVKNNTIIDAFDCKAHNRFACKDCKMIFSSSIRFMNHKDDKNRCKKPQRGRGEFMCDHCSFVTCYKHLLSRHIRFKHLGETGFICSYCGKNCIHQSILKAHMRTHSKHFSFVCAACGKAYRTALGLKNHMTIHTGELPYKCDYCNKKFRSCASRGDHVRRLHEPAASLRCHLCPSAFKVQTDLNKHMERHKNLKSKVNKMLYKT